MTSSWHSKRRGIALQLDSVGSTRRTEVRELEESIGEPSPIDRGASDAAIVIVTGFDRLTEQLSEYGGTAVADRRIE